MKLSEWKRIREKVQQQQLTEEDIQLLQTDHIIELDEIERPSQIEQNEYDNTGEKSQGFQKTLRRPGAPSFAEEEQNQKAGFSNVLLLAVISFITEILFIGLMILIYQ